MVAARASMAVCGHDISKSGALSHFSFPSHSTVQTTCAIRAAVIPVIFVVAAACIWSCGVFSFCRREITAQSICAQSPVSGPEVLRRLLCYRLAHAANSATPGAGGGRPHRYRAPVSAQLSSHFASSAPQPIAPPQHSRLVFPRRTCLAVCL